MTPTTPREALELADDCFITLVGHDQYELNIDAIITALAPFLRTPGTVEVCKSCKNELPAAKSIGCLMRDSACPFKQVTNEKA